MKRPYKSPTTSNGQAGIASILITIVMMVVLSIIVLGFATASRREQSQALDNQLSASAFYAAETGINDARNAIASFLEANPTASIPAKTECKEPPGDPNDDPSYTSLSGNVLDKTNDVEYSCLLINPQPQNLQFIPLTGGSHVIPLNAGSVGNTGIISNITLRWTLTNDVASTLGGIDPLSSCPTTTTYATFQTSWPPNCKFGALRIDLVPVPDPGASFTVDSLMKQTTSAFLIPTIGGGGALTAVSQGAIVPANCTDAGATSSCSVVITGLNLPHYDMRVQWLYKDVNLQVSARDNLNQVVELNGSQVVIDSTGTAEQVQRRIQVRLSTSSSLGPDLPAINDAIQTTEDLCKRFIITPSGANATADNPTPGEPFAYSFGNNVTGCGATGSVSGPNNKADIGDCSIDPTGPICTGQPAPTNQPPLYVYDVNLFNTSPAGQDVVSCSWNWGFGDPPTSGPATDPSNACLPNQSIYHCFKALLATKVTSPPVIPSIVLTLTLADGSTATHTYNSQAIPFLTTTYFPNEACGIPAS